MPKCRYASSASIAIIVVNWNAGSQLASCIDSIDQYGGEEVAEVIVVDNGSIDGSESIAENRLGVTLVRQGANLGFAQACNVGAKLSSREYLLFLNPDAALFENTLRVVLAFMRDTRNLDVGICGVQLVGKTGRVERTCARFPNSYSLLMHSIGIDRIIPKLGYVMAEWDHGQTCRVPHVMGAFFMVRSDVFDTLGGFDEQFFVYLEDLDFSRRANIAGWSSAYLTNAQAFHAGGGTSRQVKAKRLFYALRSQLLYAYKHCALVGFVGVIVTTLFLEIISRSVFALFSLSWRGLIETWRAYSMLLRWMLKWLLKGTVH